MKLSYDTKNKIYDPPGLMLEMKKYMEISVIADGNYKYTLLDEATKATRAYINSKEHLVIEDHLYRYSTKIIYTFKKSEDGIYINIRHNYVPFMTPSQFISLKGNLKY